MIHSESARIGTPGKYVYEDNATINRKKKVKYNVKGKNEYTSDVQRFPSPNERDMVPGPGTYTEKRDSSLSPFPRISDRGDSLERNNSFEFKRQGSRLRIKKIVPNPSSIFIIPLKKGRVICDAEPSGRVPVGTYNMNEVKCLGDP